MSFVWFRKYHKPFLWFAVIFTILVFATFSGLGDLNRMFQRTGDADVLGEFKVLTTGEIRQVREPEFSRVRMALNRWAYAAQRGGSVENDQVWSHLMLVADARGAGLEVADTEVARMFPADLTPEQYRTIWSVQLQFPSASDFEAFARDLLLAQRWAQLSSQTARVVDADEIYLRWRTDNELFDLEAVVVPDLPLDQIMDPAPEVLKAWWDEMPEPQRNARFVEPQRQDIVYAWWPLDGTDGVPDETLAAAPQPTDDEVAGRFEQTKAKRWPDLQEPDEATKAAVARELKLVALARQTSDAFGAREDQSKATFTESMTAAGLRVEDPEGELGTEELKALPGIGDELLPVWLGQRAAGDVHFGYPYAGQGHVEIVYLETVTPSHALGFEEAHDQVVKAWKEQQRDKPAKDFRARVRELTRERPEVAAIITPLIEAATQRADTEAAAQAELDEAGREALRKQILDAAEQQEVLPRVAEYEHLVWADVPLPDGARRLELEGVSRGYARKPTGEETADSIERFLKTNGMVYRLAADAISEPLRHGVSSQTAIVRVTARSFPDKAVMLADKEGMETSRRQLQAQRQGEAGRAASPEQLKLDHELRVLNQDLLN